MSKNAFRIDTLSQLSLMTIILLEILWKKKHFCKYIAWAYNTQFFHCIFWFPTNFEWIWTNKLWNMIRIPSWVCRHNENLNLRRYYLSYSTTSLHNDTSSSMIHGRDMNRLFLLLTPEKKMYRKCKLHNIYFCYV